MAPDQSSILAFTIRLRRATSTLLLALRRVYRISASSHHQQGKIFPLSTGPYLWDMLALRLGVFWVFIGLLMACSSKDSPAPGNPGNPNNPNNPSNPVVPYPDFMRGVDLSFLPEVEAEGTVFLSNSGASADVIELLKSRGCNTIRIRLWHTPTGPHSTLQEVEALADRVRAAGLKVYLSLHYSDTWADPGAQTKPAAWAGLSFTDLKDSVYRYTKMVVNHIQPDYIQIGNEINGGMVWEDGRISNLGNFIALVKEGSRAVREVLPASKIMIHFAGTTNADWFFTQMKNATVDYDLIGLSYYPVWHGTSLETLKTTVNALITDTDKPVVIAETAYPFTLQWNDNTNNIVGLPTQLVPGYPATTEGQKNFILAIKSMLKQNSKGAGFCYWGGDWVAFRGATALNGSAAENQALFGFDLIGSKEHKEVSATEAFTP